MPSWGIWSLLILQDFILWGMTRRPSIFDGFVYIWHTLVIVVVSFTLWMKSDFLVNFLGEGVGVAFAFT